MIQTRERTVPLPAETSLPPRPMLRAKQRLRGTGAIPIRPNATEPNTRNSSNATHSTEREPSSESPSSRSNERTSTPEKNASENPRTTPESAREKASGATKPETKAIPKRRSRNPSIKRRRRLPGIRRVTRPIVTRSAQLTALARGLRLRPRPTEAKAAGIPAPVHTRKAHPAALPRRLPKLQKLRPPRRKANRARSACKKHQLRTLEKSAIGSPIALFLCPVF